MDTMNVVLQWGSLRSANLGVRALTEGNLQILDAVASRIGVKIKVTIVGPYGGGAQARAVCDEPAAPREHLVIDEIATRYGFPPLRGYVSALHRSDLVLDLGQGDSFSTIYGRRRFVSQTVTKTAAASLAPALILAPQTFGPYESRIALRIATILIRSARRSFSRDSELSEQLDLAGGLKIDRAADVAYTVEAKAPANPPSWLNEPGLVGLNVSGLLWQQCSQYQISDYRGQIDRIVEAIRQRGLEPVLVPHVLGMGEFSDERVLAEVSAAHGIARAFVPRSFGEAKWGWSKFEAIVASRMHACIGGVASGVATLPLSYSPKFVGQFGLVRYPVVLDQVGVSPETVARSVADFLDRRSEYAAAAEAAAERGRSGCAKYGDSIAAVLLEARSDRNGY